jgi:hypothetical protein
MQRSTSSSIQRRCMALWGNILSSICWNEQGLLAVLPVLNVRQIVLNVAQWTTERAWCEAA